MRRAEEKAISHKPHRAVVKSGLVQQPDKIAAARNLSLFVMLMTDENMKITETKVTKKLLTDLKALDPVTFIAEDLGDERGKLTVDCFGQAWTAYWGAMGCDSVTEFINDCDVHYLANKLSSTDSTIVDYEAVGRKIGIIVDKDSMAYYVDDLIRVYGSEWWEDLPRTDNPDYVYLCRILNAVKEAVKTELAKST